MAAGLRLNDPFSIITLPMAGRPGGERATPWENLFAWPRQGDIQVPFDAASREARIYGRPGWTMRWHMPTRPCCWSRRARPASPASGGPGCRPAIMCPRWRAPCSSSHRRSTHCTDRAASFRFARGGLALSVAGRRRCRARACFGDDVRRAPSVPAARYASADGDVAPGPTADRAFSAGVVEQDLRVLRTLGIPER